tara:strand:- start:3046 stop:4959 length:1914 start_codon:yes stop_codon:yes gene_type:complete
MPLFNSEQLEELKNFFFEFFVGREDANWIKADGVHKFIAEQSMNSNKLVDVTDPTAAQDAATKNYVDTNFTSKVTKTAGEALTAGDTVLLGDGSTTLTHEKNTTSNSDAQFGDNTASTKVAQSFQSSIAIDVDKITLRIRKILAPTDNVTVSIQADSAGEPDGSDIDSVNLAGTSLTTSYVNTQFDLGSANALSASTTYWIVVTRSGAVDSSNYYEIEYQNTSVYASGQLKNFDSVTGNWETTDYGATSDAYFKVEFTTVDGSAYLTRLSSSLNTGLFIGFVDATVAKAATATITTGGVISGLSGLTSGSRYYLSNTFGTISTTAGDFTRFIGYALGATQLFINPSETLSITETVTLTAGEDIAAYEAIGTSGQVVQTTAGITCGEATYGDAGSADTNFDDDDIQFRDSSGGSEKHGFMSFISAPATPSGSGITVTKWEIRLQGRQFSGNTNQNLLLKELNAPFDETTLTWNNKPAMGSEIFALVFVGGAFDSGWFEVTEDEYNNVKNNGIGGEYDADNGAATRIGDEDDGTPPLLDVRFTVSFNDGEAYTADAGSATHAGSFIGFALAAANDTESVSVQVVGVVTNAAWSLTIGDRYYLSDTKGAIATSAGSNTIQVGVAIAATKLLIINDTPTAL